MFIGSLGEEEYLLGTTSAGLRAAIRRMAELRRETRMETSLRPPGVCASGTPGSDQRKTSQNYDWLDPLVD
jgi:hypothetical protein